MGKVVKWKLVSKKKFFFYSNGILIDPPHNSSPIEFDLFATKTFRSPHFFSRMGGVF